jgi:restriction system protein
MSIIRAKYLSIPQTSNEIHKMLLNLGWRRFEILVSKLYKKMGYEVELTRRSKDDGADMVCYRTDPGRRELLIGQCKCYTGNVGLKHFKELLGTVTDRKATKGVLVTPGKFTKPAIEKAASNPSIELLGGVELQSLLAQHLGSRWIINLDLLTIESTKN